MPLPRCSATSITKHKSFRLTDHASRRIGRVQGLSPLNATDPAHRAASLACGAFLCTAMPAL
jgi:hypothetical protein